MKEIELDGDDWVLINWETKDCILDPSVKGPIAFSSEQEASEFQHLHNVPSAFTPTKVRQLRVQ